MDLTGLDLWIFQAVNGLSGRSFLADQVVFFFSESNLVKTIPFVTCIWLLWRRPETSREQREILVGLIVAVTVALFITRGLSAALPFRARPYVTPDIGFHEPLFAYQIEDNLTDWSSFPSDHATFFFALATGFWFISRWLGFFFGLFSVWIVWQRIYLGLHYPSDILAGALIGVFAAIIVNLRPIRKFVSAPAFWLEARTPMLFNALFFLALFEMGVLFKEIRQVIKGILIVLHHYDLL